MTIVDGKVSLKHLVTMETLSNEEVLGLIQRGLAFKKVSLLRYIVNIMPQIYSLRIQHALTNHLKWLNLD